MFLAPWFALAGILAAAGPILIHFLNRRRYRVVEWAAMDFLREALYRSRRILQLRDLLLLVLRTACILIFGFALARPYFSRLAAATESGQPVHAVMLIDNSLSMAYEELDGSVLALAKAKAKDLIDALPQGSRTSIIPVCGSPNSFSLQPYPNRDDALEALAAIEPVDRAATPAAAIDLALEACGHAPEMPAKRIFLVSDHQAAGRPSDALADQLKQLPAPIEVVQVAPRTVENAWVESFSLQDGLADTQTPAQFLATIRYQGDAPRSDVVVTLSVNGSPVADVHVDLVPGSAPREIQFPPYTFDVPTQPGHPTLVPAEVAMSADRLPADDRRALVVPVVAALPVVFVDSLGPDENPRRNRYGETFHLRRLLAPRTARDPKTRQLIEIRHTTIDRLEPDTLADARLVVIAGVTQPEDAVPVLRQYVEQGGRLVLAAGAEFDPAQWQSAAWLDGLGILPAPLEPAPVGILPSEPGELQSFQLDPDSLVDERFLLEQTSRQELEDLYRLPYFFKAVAADMDKEAMDALVRNTRREIDGRRQRLAEIDRKIDGLGDRAAVPASSAALEDLQRQRAEVEPNWLVWAASLPRDDERLAPADLAERSRPRVLASFTNGLPFAIERRIGRGTVLMLTSGIYPRWNTLSLTNAVVLYDRILRSQLGGPMPQRNLSTDDDFVLPVAAGERSATFQLSDPKGQQESLTPEALNGGSQYGLTIRRPSQRGIYRVTARPNQDGSQPAELKLWEVPLAVNGPAAESELLPPEGKAGPATAGPADDLWVVEGRTAGAAAVQAAGHHLWKFLLVAVLAGLLLEIGLLAYTRLAGERPA